MMDEGTSETRRNDPDPRYHSANIKRMLGQVERHARADVGVVTDLQAKALFETTAEVLKGLRAAYDHFERNSEPAWPR
jgi:hypothetical protein